MFQRVGSYYYFFPTFAQGRKILWDGTNKEGMRFIDHFPKELIAGEINNTEMKIRTINGSLFQIVGTDNYNSVVGTNPIGCVFSEYALQDPDAWDLFRPILMENGGWAIFIYTPRGQNHGKRLYEMAKDDPNWFAQLLTIDDTVRDDGSPIITRAAIEDERKQGMSDDLIEQEFFCSFDVVGGQAFDFQKKYHVVPSDIPIPEFAPLFFCFDWGYGHPFSAQWWYVDHEDRLFHFHEWYGWNGEPNVGLRLTDEEIARGIIEIEKTLGITNKDITRLAGPDCFNKKPDYKGGGQGPSTADIFDTYNIKLLPGDPSRDLKIRQFRSRLFIPENKETKPMLQVYENCKNFIRTIPLIPVDKNKIEYIDVTSENHCFDSACHLMMARPVGISQTDVDKVIKERERQATYEKLPTLARIAWEEERAQNEQIEEDRKLELEAVEEYFTEILEGD